MTSKADLKTRRALARKCLSGLSVGDAFGQQFASQPELVGRRELPMFPWTFTDDTIMGIAVTQCLEINEHIHQSDLAIRFARAYDEDPHRGYGDTAKKILRAISDGTDWQVASSNAFRGLGSMGNGAAMRSGPIGAWYFNDLERVADEAKRSAEVTHMHLDGQAGAIAVAVATALACAWQMEGKVLVEQSSLLNRILPFMPSCQTADGIVKATSLNASCDVHEVAAELGNGSQITSRDTVPFCLWAAQSFLTSFEESMWQTASVFGDLDTNCAIVGSIVVMANGAKCIPDDWLLSREPLNG